jgi:hypothetical protein
LADPAIVVPEKNTDSAIAATTVSGRMGLEVNPAALFVRCCVLWDMLSTPVSRARSYRGLGQPTRPITRILLIRDGLADFFSSARGRGREADAGQTPSRHRWRRRGHGSGRRRRARTSSDSFPGIRIICRDRFIAPYRATPKRPAPYRALGMQPTITSGRRPEWMPRSSPLRLQFRPRYPFSAEKAQGPRYEVSGPFPHHETSGGGRRSSTAMRKGNRRSTGQASPTGDGPREPGGSCLCLRVSGVRHSSGCRCGRRNCRNNISRDPLPRLPSSETLALVVAGVWGNGVAVRLDGRT